MHSSLADARAAADRVDAYLRQVTGTPNIALGVARRAVALAAGFQDWHAYASSLEHSAAQVPRSEPGLLVQVRLVQMPGNTILGSGNYLALSTSAAERLAFFDLQARPNYQHGTVHVLSTVLRKDIDEPSLDDVERWVGGDVGALPGVVEEVLRDRPAEREGSTRALTLVRDEPLENRDPQALLGAMRAAFSDWTEFVTALKTALSLRGWPLA